MRFDFATKRKKKIKYFRDEAIENRNTKQQQSDDDDDDELRRRKLEIKTLQLSIDDMNKFVLFCSYLFASFCFFLSQHKISRFVSLTISEIYLKKSCVFSSYAISILQLLVLLISFHFILFCSHAILATVSVCLYKYNISIHFQPFIFRPFKSIDSIFCALLLLTHSCEAHL